MTQKELRNKNIEHEKGCVKVFLKNNSEKLNQWIIEKHTEQSSPVDIVAENKTTHKIIKTQVRWIDDDLIQKFYGNRIFYGERTYTQVIDIIKGALEKKNKHTSSDTKEIILLLNGWHLWNILKMFKILQNPKGEDVKNLIESLQKVPIKNFKEIYIVTEKFNICIK